MGTVIVRRQARADVRAAALWYEGQRAGLGIEFTLEFDAIVARISQNPLQFPEIASGVRRALLRRFPYSVYFVVGTQPSIIAVLHQHRHPDRWKQRL